MLPITHFASHAARHSALRRPKCGHYAGALSTRRARLYRPAHATASCRFCFVTRFSLSHSRKPASPRASERDTTNIGLGPPASEYDIGERSLGFDGVSEQARSHFLRICRASATFRQISRHSRHSLTANIVRRSHTGIARRCGNIPEKPARF